MIGVADDADADADADDADDCSQPRAAPAFISAGEEMPPTPLPMPPKPPAPVEDRDADADDAEEEEEEDGIDPKRGKGDWYMLCAAYRAAPPRSCGDEML
jgi:hypothetical protein